QGFNRRVSDASGLASYTVTITRNGATIFSCNADGSFDFNSYGVGTYELSVSATDADNDRANDNLSSSMGRTVVISDDDTTPPLIVLGGSQGSEYDGQNQNFTWNVTDASGLDSVRVTIHKNGSVIQTLSSTWGALDLYG